MSGEAEAKANGFNSTAKELEKMVGAQFPSVVAALPADTAALIARPPLNVAWIPMRHVRGLMRVAFEVPFNRDLSKMTELGRLTIARDLSGVYSVFIRIASPKFVTERAAKLWGNYARNAGGLTVIDSGPNHALLEYKGIFESAPFYWAYQRGTVLAALQATGIKGAAAEIVAGGGTDGHAQIRASWQ